MDRPEDPAAPPASAGPSQDMLERFAALKALDDPASARTLAAGQPVAAPATTPADDARYSFEAVFAEGGLGRIRRAHDRRLRRTVAVKEMREHLAHSAAAARFRREALLTARLEHPAIVSVQDLGEHPDGAPYYCMKLVDGDSLHALVRARPQLAERLALLPHVVAVADALAYAHDKRVIHRDLKPANVLVGAFGETVVIDWGLAKDLDEAEPPADRGPPAPVAADAALTRTGEFLGTLPFMPVEQAETGRTDARADVYAIGAILYFVLASELPYGDLPAADALQALLAGPPPDLATRVGGLPEDLLAIVRKAMAWRADDRYPTAKELAADLHRFTAGRLVSARPYSPFGLVRHYARRYSSLLAVAAVGVLALAATVAYSYASVARERDVATAATAATAAALHDARAAADDARLAQARAALGSDLADALTALAAVDLADPTTARRARLLALAAEARGAPTLALRGHTRPIRGLVALADGGLVSVDAAGSVWRWDPAGSAGREVLALGRHGVTLTAATTAPVWAALTPDSAHVVRADGSHELLAVDVTRAAGLADAYAWTLSADGSAFAALGRPVTLAGAEPGPAAVVWDLRRRPAVRRDVGVRDGAAALSPDGRTVAYESARTTVLAGPDGRTTVLPGLARPLFFSSGGTHVLGFAGGPDDRHVAAPIAGGPPVDLGRWTLDAVAGDRALVFDETVLFGDYRTTELALRDILTGRALWSERSEGAAGLGAWTGPDRRHDLAVDPRGEWLALRDGERWRLGPLAVGARPRALEIGFHPHAAMLVDGRFAAAHGTDVWLWDRDVRPAAPPLTIAAVAPTGKLVGHTAARPSPGLWDMSRGTSSDLPCLAAVTAEALADGATRLATDAQDRVLFAAAGRACVGDTTRAHPLDLPPDVTALALADVGPTFAVGTRGGLVLAYGGPDAAPERWQLGHPLHGLTAAPGGGFVAHDAAGHVHALRLGDREPTRIAEVPVPHPGTLRTAAIATVAHPSAPRAATVISESDLLVVHDFATATTTRRALRLGERPIAAWSPAGRLAVALGGASLAVLDAAGDPRELALPEGAVALDFIDEQQLVVQGDGGSLLRVDLEIGEHATLGRTWDPAAHIDGLSHPSVVVAAPDGAVVALTAELTLVPADTVPPIDALAPWLTRRAAALAPQADTAKNY